MDSLPELMFVMYGVIICAVMLMGVALSGLIWWAGHRLLPGAPASTTLPDYSKFRKPQAGVSPFSIEGAPRVKKK